MGVIRETIWLNREIPWKSPKYVLNAKTIRAGGKKLGMVGCT